MKTISVIIPLIFFSQVVPGQEQSLDTLVKKFKYYRVNALQEKMFAHLDRSFYLTGETLWFKVYTVDGTFHKPLNVSKVAYVEILDKANLPVLQAKIQLESGIGNGSFFLPATLNSGNYRFRLYTNWMKNFSPEYFFSQDFTIVNPFVRLEPAQRETPTSYTADFFPEGGNMVAGVQNKIGFRITDATGKGVSCAGYVLNDKNDTVSSFSPTRFGIGHFLFTPSADRRYRVMLKDGQGKTSLHPFTEVYPSGYVLHLQDSGQYLRVSVTTQSLQLPYVYLFVHARQIMAKAELQTLRQNKAVFILNKNELPDGISHFTVFNEQLEPLCERLYFTYPEKILEIDLKGSQPEYNYRKRVAVSIQTSNNSGTPLPANLSMSVFRIDSLPGNQPAGIFHHLWLNADLAGTIESPEYYFNKSDPSAPQAMDDLMLTHGWRKFDWKDILERQQDFAHVPEQHGHIINGSVSNDQGRQSHILTYLASPGKVVRVYGSRSNIRGEILFDIKDFYGSRQIIVQRVADSAHNYQVNIQNPFSTDFDAERVPELKISKDSENALLSRSIAMQVQDIYYYDQYSNRYINPAIDSSAFYGEADATYLLDDYTRFQIMEEVMREYVPGVLVRKRKDGFHFIMVDLVNGGLLRGDPMILLDGVPIFDADEIMELDPLRIKKLEVVKRQYYLGHAAFAGILSYSTYQGDLGGLQLNPTTISLNYDGLHIKRQFYSPHYNQGFGNRKPDLRYLLHWEPEIITGENGRQEVEFYTSDVPGQYMVVVEGLNNDGYSGTKKYTFTVKAPDSQ